MSENTQLSLMASGIKITADSIKELLDCVWGSKNMYRICSYFGAVFGSAYFAKTWLFPGKDEKTLFESNELKDTPTFLKPFVIVSGFCIYSIFGGIGGVSAITILPFSVPALVCVGLWKLLFRSSS
jgi:hypothetical protein